jgi:hypothetical protein
MELTIVQFIKKQGLNALEDLNIQIKYHQKYPNLVLLKYSQLDSDFSNPIVQQARGIILDINDNFKVISYGYNKFFNYSEPLAAHINWDNALFYEKVDGSLLQLFWYDNQWNIATSGSPDGSGNVGNNQLTFAELFWQVFNELNYKLPEHYFNIPVTYLFELCTSLNQVVIPHQRSRLVFHGARNLSPDTGYYELPYEALYACAEYYNWELVKTFQFKNINEVLLYTETLNGLEQEGFVVCDRQNNRIKIKSADYVKLHHLRSGFSTKNLLEVVRSFEGAELISYFPYWQSKLEEIRNKYFLLVLNILNVFDQIKTISTRKEFAQKAIKYSFSGVLFQMLDGKTLRSILQDMNIKSLMNLLSLDNEKETQEDDSNSN